MSSATARLVGAAASPSRPATGDRFPLQQPFLRRFRLCSAPPRFDFACSAPPRSDFITPKLRFRLFNTSKLRFRLFSTSKRRFCLDFALQTHVNQNQKL
ncbi:hypothetical protein LXL04_037415 [Taraxacum kok-saghyz]